MNIQQLRIIAEASRQNFNFTAVARALYISQPAISKSIKEFEDELGVELFIRRGKRILGFTEVGNRLLGLAEEILGNIRKIKSLKNEFFDKDSGTLTLATTHTQARYVLPDIIKRYTLESPKVQFVLHQSSPLEIASMLDSGDADIAIATESLKNDDRFITFPFYQWHHGIIVPKAHTLLSCRDVTLNLISKYPIITYHKGFTGREKIDKQFVTKKLSQNIVLEALDADVIKAYVSQKLGIGIIASMAYDENQDSGLALIEGDKIFEKNTTYLALRKGQFLKGFVAKFVCLCINNLTIEDLNLKILNTNNVIA